MKLKNKICLRGFLILSALSLVAFDFRVGEMVEVGYALNARKSPKFYKNKRWNRIYSMAKGTTGTVVASIPLPSGNTGVKITLTSGPRKGQDVWAYFDEHDPRGPALKRTDKGAPQRYADKGAAATGGSRHSAQEAQFQPGPAKNPDVPSNGSPGAVSAQEDDATGTGGEAEGDGIAPGAQASDFEKGTPVVATRKQDTLVAEKNDEVKDVGIENGSKFNLTSSRIDSVSAIQCMDALRSLFQEPASKGKKGIPPGVASAPGQSLDGQKGIFLYNNQSAFFISEKDVKAGKKPKETILDDRSRAFLANELAAQLDFLKEEIDKKPKELANPEVKAGLKEVIGVCEKTKEEKVVSNLAKAILVSVDNLGTAPGAAVAPASGEIPKGEKAAD